MSTMSDSDVVMENRSIRTPEAISPKSFSDAAAAVEHLIYLFDRATAFLRDSFKSAASECMPENRVRAFYPELRFEVSSHIRVDTRLSYGFVARPGKYKTTITRPDLFRDYLEHQIELLIKNHGLEVVIAESDQQSRCTSRFMMAQTWKGQFRPRKSAHCAMYSTCLILP